ncbi:hypothetical protein C7S20_15470 [Christiangramia fulva]|uniref:Haem-binding domain-containing protein n=1 Tax=Christiangramia fulva TaxID=2126553 RepID=A0A2R3Z8F0_9FLAO|nr:heme-binding domain-containing protein [Christiangramia fulva]AVR46551.1 hypothetical protein C7S20_15470 [Christiangramia fulva]
MKILKITLGVFLVIMLVVQFVPRHPNKSSEIPPTDFTKVNEVPQPVKGKLFESCYDCHSNNTRYPWYNRVQPVAWFLDDHITAGKKELNFSEWANYSDRRKNSKLRSIISQVEDGEMPLDSYTFLHKEAVFSEKEKKEFLDYMRRLKKGLEL